MGYKIMKWAAAVIAISVLIFAVIGGYALFESMFPMAEPLEYPSADEVTAITVEAKEGGAVTLGQEEYENLIEGIRDAEPTREWSVNDYPTEKSYYTLSLSTDGRLYRYFVYRDGGRVYIESAYEGVYLTSEDYLLLVENYLEVN